MSNTLSGTKILVTGGAGFIGSNLLDRFLAEGAEVVCLDNFCTGHRRNIEQLLENTSFTLIEGDIRDMETCQAAVKGCTHVCHQAALGSVPRSVTDPLTTNEINITGTLNLLIAAKEAGIKRFVYASSSSVYGDEPTLPKVENRVGRLLSPYAVTKSVMESYAMVFAGLHGLETIGLRYFNVFGRRQDPEGAYAAVIPKFVDLLIKGESPKIFGDGEQSRDFTYIENVIQLNLKALLTTDSRAFGEVFNGACGTSITVNELFSQMRELISNHQSSASEVTPIHMQERPGDIRHSLANIDKAKEILGYQPSHDIQSGMVEAMDWYWESLN